MDDNNTYSGYDYTPEPAPEPAVEPAPPPEPYFQPPMGYQPYPPGGFPPGYWQQPAPAPPPKKKSALPALIAVLGVLILLTGIFAGLTTVKYFRLVGGNNPSAAPPETTLDSSRLEMADTPAGDKSIAQLAGGLTPVQIHEKLRGANVAVQLYSGRSNSAVGEGSGILIHEDATKTYTYVVTCAHVISDNRRVSVELENGDSYDAEVVGYDSKTDVGLLRIKKTGLQGASFGDSSKLQVGEPIYAIGNPGGVDFKGSFTNGIVSAVDRAITSRYKMMTIQHTAPISPGNSGGALVNALGQVIGINSQKIVDMQYEGMGFAIPSKIVQEVVNSLIERGYVANRPKLGIEYTAAMQTQLGAVVVRTNDLPSGSVIIATISEESDLSGTEVRANDIITHVNGEALSKPDVLLQAVETGKVGDVLKLKVARVNSTNLSIEVFEVSVKLIEDKGTSAPVEETRPWWQEQFPFGDPFGGGFEFPW